MVCEGNGEKKFIYVASKRIFEQGTQTNQKIIFLG
jgi:hypothetical protein